MSFIKKIKWLFIDLGIQKNIPDEKYLKKVFKKKIGKELDLSNPKTYNEKLQWLKINDRNPLYTKLVDKYEVKEYVSDIISDEYIIPTLGIYDSFEKIDFNKLPDQFVMKCTHDSGGLYICKDKSKLNKRKLKIKFNFYLKRNFYYRFREWPYKNVKPRIMIEKYMKDDTFPELIDYKVMCFNGEPKIIFTCTDRYSDELKVTFFDCYWNKLPFKRHYPSSNKKIEKPVNLKKMLELSKIMSKGIRFVRIDWYEVNGKLYFGEYTFFPRKWT